MTTRLYFHPVCLEHAAPAGHPERPDRLRAIERALSGSRFDSLERESAPLADPERLRLVHEEAHVERVESMIPQSGIAHLDPDTHAGPKSLEAALRAVGAAIDAVDAVFAKEAENCFTALRPPGHHAERNRAMGFCLFNSVAVAARHARDRHGVERVAIVDFDVHHGNGTQDIFEDDPNVLFASTHQMPLYPGTGAANETGVGNVFNAPLREGDSGETFREAMQTRILPAIRNFSPDLILLSSGFDAHRRDPLAGINLEADDFDWITGRLMELAGEFCDDRLVSVLEGGYDLEGLAESVSSHVNRLMKG